MKEIVEIKLEKSNLGWVYLTAHINLVNINGGIIARSIQIIIPLSLHCEVYIYRQPRKSAGGEIIQIYHNSTPRSKVYI